MKKLLTTLVIIASSGWLSAQSSLQIVSQTYGVVNSQTLTFYITQGATHQLDFQIVSSLNPAPSLYVHKYEQQIGSTSYVTYSAGGLHYAPATVQSLNFSLNDWPDFQTEYNQSLTVCDTAIVRFSIVNTNNPADSAWFTLVYYCVGGPAAIEDDVNIATIQIMPNPVTDQARLTFSSRSVTSIIEVYNSLGECITSLPVSPSTTQAEINCSDLQNGLYFVRLIGVGEVRAQQSILVLH